MAIQLSAKTEVKVGELVVKNLTSIPSFSEQKSTVEVTSLDNEGRVYINGLKEPNESLEFSGFYDGAEFKKLRDLAEQGGQHEIQIKLPDGVTISFTGEISVAIGELSVGEAMTFVLAITPNTDVTFDFTAIGE